MTTRYERPAAMFRAAIERAKVGIRFRAKRSSARLSATHDRPALGNPSRDTVAHIVDVPVSELLVQKAGDYVAARAAMAEYRDGPAGVCNCRKCRQPPADVVASLSVEEGQQVAAADDTGLAPFLRCPDVDDG